MHEPQMREGHPIWWHHHGAKMMLKHLDLTKRVLVLAGSSAKIRIERKRKDYWLVCWSITHGVAHCRASGMSVFTTENLSAAFGLTDTRPIIGWQWLIDVYGGTCAAQFKFIRWEDFLNIPCPGTGHDGDPNISVELSEEIKDAVRQLIADI